MPNKNRIGGSRWKRIMQQVLVEENYICHLCGHKGANSADHLIPIKFAPELEFVRENLHAVHRSCNYKRGVKPLKPRVVVRTSREW